MKTVRKIMVCLLSFMMCLGVICSTGCAWVRAGTMEQLIGTYELTEYVRILNDATDNKEATKEDLLREKGIELFLVVTGKDIGYLSYKDNETEHFVREVRLSYDYDVEDSTKIETIGYEFGGQNRTDLKSYMGTLGFLSGKKALNNTNPKYESSSSGCTKKHDDKVYFEKQSKAIDTKYIENKYGTLKIERYAQSRLYDYYEYNYNYSYGDVPYQFSDYIYMGFEVNKFEDTANIYYATKNEQTQQSKMGVAVDYVVSEDRTSIEKMTIDGITYIVDVGSVRLEKANEEEQDFYINGGMIQEDKVNYFNSIIDEYKNSLGNN